MARANFVKKARKAQPEAGIEVGDSYWWWEFRFGGKHVSKTKPRASQLTGSAFLSQVYAAHETLEDCAADREELRCCIEGVCNDLESLKDETQGSLDNMPESLQQGPTGELLQDRVDELDNYISELQSVDCDDETTDPDDLKQEILDLSYNGS